MAQPTPIVAVLYIIRHVYVHSDVKPEDLRYAFERQDQTRPVLSFGVFERPNGDVDLADMELNIRKQMTAQSTQYSDILLVTFRDAAEAQQALEQLHWEDLHLDHDSLWSRLCLKHAVISSLGEQGALIKDNAALADYLEEVWLVFLDCLRSHDFTYNSQELDEATWMRHNKKERQILRCRWYLHEVGKGELADFYYDKLSESCTKATFLPVDVIPHLLADVERYKKLLGEHDFWYRRKNMALSFHQKADEQAEVIFQIRRKLHAMGQGAMADQLYLDHAPAEIAEGAASKEEAEW